MVARGETFYAGDRLNKALVKPEAIEALLQRALGLIGTGPLVVDPGAGGSTLLGADDTELQRSGRVAGTRCDARRDAV